MAEKNRVSLGLLFPPISVEFFDPTYNWWLRAHQFWNTPCSVKNPERLVFPSWIHLELEVTREERHRHLLRSNQSYKVRKLSHRHRELKGSTSYLQYFLKSVQPKPFQVWGQQAFRKASHGCSGENQKAIFKTGQIHQRRSVSFKRPNLHLRRMRTRLCGG